MDIDLSFFDAIQAVWIMFFGFFPSWFQTIVLATFGLAVAGFGLKLVKFLKDLLWPF